jgi:peptidoglycan/LPS O-acetylase OafA/YrhL
MDRAPATSQRLVALDGIRGLAALCVVAFHLKAPLGFAIAPGGGLAVDLFFLLSGLVLARTYDARFAAGMNSGQFLRARLLRLYPLYALGLAISFLFAAAYVYRPGLRLEIVASFVLGALYLPTPEALAYDPRYMFPANIPAWSLFFELLVNAVFAVTALALNRERLLILIGLAAAGLAACALFGGGVDEGAQWRGFHVGVLRVLFSFFAGVYIARHHLRPLSPGTWQPFLIAVLLLTPLLLPIASRWRALFDLGVVLALWPLLVNWAAGIELQGKVRRMAAGLGDMSYALYALHLPLLNWAMEGSSSLFGLGWGEQPPLFALLFILLALGIALLAHRFYDGPACALLRRLVEQRRWVLLPSAR